LSLYDALRASMQVKPLKKKPKKRKPKK